MIFTERKITVRNGKSSINEPVILYRGDYEISIKFIIMESKFRFKSGVNLVDSEKASHGQLAILAPYGGNVFSEIVKCEEGTVTFVLTKEMIDQLEEVGLYSFQIRLFDYYRESRVSIPPVEFGIEVREPVASEDHDNSVNNAIVGYSIAKVVDGLNEDVPDTFDANGNYNKTEWETGDRISEGKLNKIEDAIDKINQNEKVDVAALDKRVTTSYNVLNSNKADIDTIWTMKNMGQDIKEAMTGGSVPVVGENAVGSANIINDSITADDIMNMYLTPILFGETGMLDFTFNDGAKTLTITLPATAYIMVGDKYSLIGANNKPTTYTISYPDHTYGVSGLWWDSALNNFIIYNFNDYSMVKGNKQLYLIASISVVCHKINISCPFTVNGEIPYISKTISGKHLKDLTISEEKIANRTISGSKIKEHSLDGLTLDKSYQPTYICSSGPIQCSFKFDNELGNCVDIHCPACSYIMQGLRYIQMEANNLSKTFRVPLPKPDDGINVVVYNTNNSKIEIYNYLTFSGIKTNELIIIGNVDKTASTKHIYLYADYRVDGGALAKECILTFRTPIIWDKNNRKIRIPEFYVIAQSGIDKYRQITPSGCGLTGSHFEFDIPAGYDVWTYYIDRKALIEWDNSVTDNECPIKIAKQASAPTIYIDSPTPIIGTAIYNNFTSMYPVDVSSNVEIPIGTFCSRYKHDAINFNWHESRIEFNTAGYVMANNKYHAPLWTNAPGGKLPVTLSGDGIYRLLFDAKTRLFYVFMYSDTITIEQPILIATFWSNGSVQTIGRFKINGQLFGEAEAEIPEIPANTIDTEFTLSDNRLILPDTMYFVKDQTLPIYLSSVTPNPSKIDAVKPTMVYTPDNLTKSMDTFTDSYIMNCNDMKNGFKFGYRQYVDDKLYYKNINVLYCDPSKTTNKAPKILHIGDSITNRYVAARSEVFLNKWGITPTYVGTMTNLGDKQGEGREGWEYANFIGLSSIWGNNNSIIVPNADGTSTGLNDNPFIKVANSMDLAQYPDWCFTYTGGLREKSYTESNNKAQSFYIFDIVNYLSAHKVDTPDIITIALSTNDITRRSDYLETCLFSMNVMLTRIREQLPNVKIGVIPSPAWGMGYDTFKNKTAGWIEECITAINKRNDDHIFVVPIWCHMNREWGFNISPNDLSDINNSKYGNISDGIHPGVDGQLQYAKAMAMFIANMCL